MREAATFAFSANLLMVVAATIAIVLLVPKGTAPGESRQSTPADVEAPAGPASRS